MTTTREFYTGIGSRQTPAWVLQTMTKIAGAMEELGLVLRSGGASGADLAFEAGVLDPALKEIYLPWKGFNGSRSHFTAPTEAAMALAKAHHPAWDRCSPAARLLHARNMHQVLGYDLASPSLFVVCWTEGAKLKGGTSQAIRLANSMGIHVFNIADPKQLSLLRAWYDERVGA